MGRKPNVLMELKSEELNASRAPGEDDLPQAKGSVKIGVDTKRIRYQNYKDWSFCSFCCTFTGTSSFTFAVLPWVFFYAASAGCVYAAEISTNPDIFWENLNYMPHFLFLIPFSMLLTLRTGFALYKFWEARTALTDCYRGIQGLIQFAHLYIEREDTQERIALQHVLRYLPVLMVTIKNNIVPNFYAQGNDGQQKLRLELAPHLDRTEVDILCEGCSANRPLLVATWISRWVVAMHKRDKLIGGHASLANFTKTIDDTLKAWMTMTKISSTPVQFSLARLLLWSTVIWVSSLSIALVNTVGGYAIAVVPIIGLLLHSTLELGNQAETPFGPHAYCLSSDMLVAAIVQDIKLLFWGSDIKLAPLDRVSAQTDAIGKMEATFTMGMDTISLHFDTPPQASAGLTKEEKEKQRAADANEDADSPVRDEAFEKWGASDGATTNGEITEVPAQTGPTSHIDGESTARSEHSNKSEKDAPLVLASISAKGPDGRTLGARIRSKGSESAREQ